MNSPKQFGRQPISTLIFLISLIMKNSAQLYLSSSQENEAINFILSMVNIPSSLLKIAVSLNIVVAVLSIISLYYWKVRTCYVQISHYILSPLILFSGVKHFKVVLREEDMYGMLFYGVGLVLTILMLLVAPFLQFPLKNYRWHSVQTISPFHPTLLNVHLLIVTLCGLCQVGSQITLALVIVLYLVRTYFVLTKISYQNPQIEYFSLLGQIYSWLSMLCIILRVFYGAQITALCWMIVLMIMYLALYPNSLITRLTQNKYLQSIENFRQALENSMDEPQYENDYLDEDLLIQFMICLIYWVEHPLIQDENKKKFNFSKYFISEIASVIELLGQKDIHLFHEHSILQNLKPLMQDEKSAQFHEQHKWAIIWRIVTSLKQTQHYKYQKLRTFIIFNFPLLNSTFNYKLLTLYYIDRHQPQQSFHRRLISDLSYHHLTEKIFLQDMNVQKTQFNLLYTNLKDIKENHQNNNKNQPRITKVQKLKYCLNPSFCHSPAASYFNHYYQVTQIQNALHLQFMDIFSKQRQLLRLISERKDNKQIFECLSQLNKKKEQIKQTISTLESLDELKFILFKFIFENSIMNTPYIAFNNFKSMQLDNLLAFKINQRNLSLNKVIKIKKNQHQNEFDEKLQNKMILFVSGMQNFGRITHSCSSFKTKMDLFDSTQTYKFLMQQNNLTIYDIMLPLWIEKHQQMTLSRLYDQNTLTHKGSKVHFISCVKRNIFQINFQIYPIVRDMNDLFWALDIQFKQIDRIQIYHNQRKVFDNLSLKYLDSTTTFIKSRKHQNFNDEICLFNTHKTKQTIFGQSYQIHKTYKSVSARQRKLRKQSKNQDNSLVERCSINPERKSEYSTTAQVSQDLKSQSINEDICSEDKVSEQIKMREYLKSHLFFDKQYKLFGFIHRSIPPFILLSCLFLRFYSSREQEVNTTIIETKTNILENFLLTETHLLTTLQYLRLLDQNAPQKNNRSNELMKILQGDIQQHSETLRSRHQKLKQQLAKSYELKQLFFALKQTEHSPSFYQETLDYEVKALESINISTIITQMDNTQTNSQYRNMQIKYSLQRDYFLKLFRHKYEEYLHKEGTGVLLKFNQLQKSANQSTSSFFRIYLVSLIGLSVTGSLFFMFVFIDMEFSLQKFVLKSLNYPVRLVKELAESVSLSQKLLQNYNKKSSYQIYNQINEKQNQLFEFQSQTSKQRYNNKKVQHEKGKIYDSPAKVFLNKLPLILILIIIVLTLEVFLILLISDFRLNIQKATNFSLGIQKLTRIVSLSNEITSDLMFKLQKDGNQSDLPAKINEYQHMQKIQFLRSLSQSEQEYKRLVYIQICKIHNKPQQQPFCHPYQQRINLSYSQIVSENIRLFKDLNDYLTQYSTYSKQLKFAQINVHLPNILKHLSLLNQFTRQIIKIGKRNLLIHKNNPQIYFNVIIFLMLFVVLSFNWFTYFKVQHSLRTLPRQVLTASPLHQLKNLQHLAFHINKAMKHKISHVSGPYST